MAGRTQRRTSRTARGRDRGGAGAPLSAPELAEMVIAATPSPGARRAVTGLLLRFISCGVLALGLGAVWRLWLAPARVGPGAAFAGIFSLLLGFITGGVLWYLRDARLRSRDPQAVSDERLVFSFVVFAVMPFAVLVFVGLVWLLVLVIGVA